MKDRLLRNALLTNAGFSGAIGALAVALGGRLEDALGPPTWSLRALGMGLLVFAVVVANEARAPGHSGTWRIIGADLLWVVAAPIIIAVSPEWLTRSGQAALALVTVAVAALAAAQWRGMEAAS